MTSTGEKTAEVRWDRWNRLAALEREVRGKAFPAVLRLAGDSHDHANELLEELWGVVLDRACGVADAKGLSDELDQLEASATGEVLAKRTVGLLASDLVFRCQDRVKSSAYSRSVSLEALVVDGDPDAGFGAGGLSVEDQALGHVNAEHVRRVVAENLSPEGIEVFRVQAVGHTTKQQQYEAGLNYKQIQEGRKNLRAVREIIRAQCGAVVIAAVVGLRRFFGNPAAAEAATNTALGNAAGAGLRAGLGIAALAAAVTGAAVTVPKAIPHPKPKRLVVSAPAITTNRGISTAGARIHAAQVATTRAQQQTAARQRAAVRRAARSSAKTAASSASSVEREFAPQPITAQPPKRATASAPKTSTAGGAAEREFEIQP